MVRPKFDREFFPNAVIREVADELTHREGEEGMQRSFINTPKVEAGRWGPPVHEDFARSLSHLQGRRGSGVGELALQVRSRAKSLWKIRDNKERADEYYHQTSEQLALAVALRRVEVWDDAGSST